VSDVVHVYERSLGVDAAGGAATVRGAAENLVATARRDLEAEGFDPAAADISVELELAANGSAARVVRAGTIDEALVDARGGHIDVARVRARFPVGAYEPVGRPSPQGATAPTPLARRPVTLAGQEHHAAIYDGAGLTGRAPVDGPAIAMGETMTCLVPPGWSLSIDEFANGVLRRGA
jgi:5-oxoprolinase (ATP-hydrolysing)